MSHLVSIKEIVFVDIDALKMAIEELQNNGIACGLQQNVTAKSLFKAQRKKYDWVIKLDDSPFDVGLYMDKDKGGYVPKVDLMGDHVSYLLGIVPREGEDRNKCSLAKLNRLDATHAAMRAAIKAGHTVQRINNRNGSIQLTVTMKD